VLAGVSVLQVGNPVAISHFASTPQSDVVRICAHDFQRHGDAFGMTENACFRAFISLRITISPTLLFSANFNGNRVKNAPNLGLVLQRRTDRAEDALHVLSLGME